MQYRNRPQSSSSATKAAIDRAISSLIEPLESRQMKSVTALDIGGVLNVFGDNNANAIVVSRDVAGKLLVNGGAVKIFGAMPTIANTKLIEVFGLDGNDNISIDETNGVLPAANLFGGAGNDTLAGGSGNDILAGESGNDMVLGKAGNDTLAGGAGDDTLTGGGGTDQVFGQSGNDRMIWNPGDGTDLNEGGDGIDTVEVNGGNGAEAFTVTANGSRVRFDRVNPAPFSIDIGTSEKLVLNANGGDDSFTAGNGLAPLIGITVDGGAGNDTLTGGDGNDTLIGGDGNDLITGGRGSDTALMGAGDDTFVWNPGDGSDTVEGQDGNDTMLFNGANVNENISLSANGNRLRLFRDVGNVTMDVNGTENVNINTLGGADNLTFNDLSATAVKQVNLDLGATPGAPGGDAQADTVIVNGTNNADNAQVSGNGSSYVVAGLATTFNVVNSEGPNDNLSVNLLGGNDSFTAAGLPTSAVHLLSVDGGTGDDKIIGSDGADALTGGDGNDVITGGRGNDTAFLGAGDDTFIWNPGDGSDTVEGQAGNDTMVFNGSNAAENIDLSANGTRLRLFRDVGNITMDTDGIENVNVNTLAGADKVSVNDLTGTAVKNVNLNLAVGGGSADGEADNVIVNGTNGDDNIAVSGTAATGAKITGLATTVTVTNSDTTDNLTVNALGGNDKIDASALTGGVFNLTENGGAGNDMLIGSQGNDFINGGTGSDIAFMGAGDDTFVWNPGDGSDTVEGQAGNDSMIFNGSNVGENIDLSANGTRLRLFRDVGNVTMDTNGVENVQVNALGGADTITVNDLTGTDVTQVGANLAASGGAGDGQVDNVIVNGTAGADAISANGTAGSISVTGLATTVNITGAEPTDKLTINGLGGDDAITASGLDANVISLNVDGGQGDDVLVGTAGNDTLRGGDGDDILIGNGGVDSLDGGTGANVVIP